MEERKRQEGNFISGSMIWEDDRSPLKDVSIFVYDENSVDGKPIATTKIQDNGYFSFSDEEIGFMGTKENIFKIGGRKRIVAIDNKGNVLSTHTIEKAHLKEEKTTLRLSVPIIKKDLIGKIALKPKIWIGNFALDKTMWDELEYEDLLNLARIDAGQIIHSSARRKLENLCRDLLPDRMAQRSLCSTETILTMYEIEKRKEWSGFTGNEIDLILTSFIEAGFAEESYETPNFIITYQTDGVQGVDPDKSAMDIIDPGSDPAVVIHTIPAGGASDPPTYIRLIEYWLEHALSVYVNAPYSLLNPASGGKIPVYVNHSSAGSASPSGFFKIHWDLSPELVCAVSVHELFHMVQFEYSLSYSDPWRQSVMEGGAVLSEDVAADAMNRYLYEASTSWSGTGVLVNPNKSLISASYDCSLFFRYISEQHSTDTSEPFIGVETYRKLIENCSADGCTTETIENTIRQLPWYEHFYKFRYRDPAQYELASSETTMGNYVLAQYLKDLGTNIPDSRFEFLEDEENIGFDEVLETQWPSSGTPIDTMGTLSLTASDTLTHSTSLNYSDSVNMFGSRYYEIQINPSVTNVEVTFSADPSFTSLLFQLVQIDEDNYVRDICRTDQTNYTKRITNTQEGKTLDRILIAVTGCNSSGGYSISVSPASPCSDVMVTRWNSVVKKEYEIRSRFWSWVSPDIWVDNDGNGLADSVVFFDYNNKLTIRLHNKGNADATGLHVDFWYQNATGGLHHADWVPVRNKNGVVRNLSGLNLAAGNSNTWSVDWSPQPSGTSKHFCVRAIVTSPGDTNTDNKFVTSNFGNIQVKLVKIIDIDLIRRHLGKLPKLVTLKTVVRPGPKAEEGIKLETILPRNRKKLMEPGELLTDRIKILPKLNTKYLKTPISLDDSKSQIAKYKNKNLESYPPEEALPPGIWGKTLVTIVHEVEGDVIGGFTAAFSMAKKE